MNFEVDPNIQFTTTSNRKPRKVTLIFQAIKEEGYSRVPAWRIPGTAEPGGLPSMGSHRVGPD